MSRCWLWGVRAICALRSSEAIAFNFRLCAIYCTFQSPCGDLVDCDDCDRRRKNCFNFRFQSPCGDTEKLDNPTSRWGHGDSPGIEEISAWIEKAAKALQDYQSVRWALADLLQSSTTRHQLKTTWTGGSGKLPSSLTLQDCHTQAVELINQFQEVVGTVTQDRFEDSLAVYQQQFAQEGFWLQKDY